jgi:hypothetical protein
MCYTTSPIGKLSELIVKAGASAEITVDTREVDEFKTYCWCCALWRGIAIGAVIGFIVGVVI